MSSRLNICLHGEAAEVADLVGGEVPKDPLEISLELRAALTNALRRIHALECCLEEHLGIVLL